MERGSDKHSPMVDDQLKHETESLVRGSPVEARSQEGREQEGPADGEPTPDVRIRGDRGDAPNGMSFDDINARADLARSLEPSVFPARAGELVETARQNYAPEETIRRLEMLPDSTYENVQQVWAALGGPVEPDLNTGHHVDEPPGLGDKPAR